ncbi:MAG TPA: hypothetical protein VIF60_11835 [Burkholderiaceae bacterium]|jgi:hypothetical protein
MEYILDKNTGGINFGPYLEYLNSITDSLPPHVYAFASDSRHYDLQSHSSLHDAWLETFNIGENANGATKQIRQIEIRMCLLGPFHDLKIHLHYLGVERYFLDAPARTGEIRFAHIGHGDLLAHEIRLGLDGLLIHELQFERGGTILIECKDILHSEEIINLG